MKIFLQLPFIVSIAIITAVCIAIFFFIQKLVERKIPHEKLLENHAIGGFMYNAVCVIYAVLIAFVVFVIWNKMEITNSRIEQEASNLTSLYYDATVFPDSIKKEIQSTIREYTKRITKDEWESLAYGKKDDEAQKQFIKLNRIFLSVKSEQVPNTEVLSQSLKNLQEIREFRRHRILSSRQNMPDILWLVLIVNSVIIVVFTFFFSTKNNRHQYVMTSFLVFVSVLVLYLIYVLDNPFVGADAIKPDAFQPLLDIIKRTGK
jgi:ABC-type multidrug transport system fused ATPase/permease subunit